MIRLFVFLSILWAGLLSAPPANAETPEVLVTIAPIHSIVATVMVGVGNPGLLMKGGASPHGMALKPSDARKLEHAALIIAVGPALEGAMARTLDRFDQTRVLTLMEAPRVRLLDGDPHIWLSPANAGAIAEVVAQRLAQIDPGHAPIYRANAEALKGTLTQLQNRLSEMLTPVKDKPFVVFHDAYRYFEQAFGLKKAGRVYAMAERGPGAAHIRALVRLMAEKNIACLFTEPQFAPKLALVVATETGARTGVLDPLGTDMKPGPDLYARLMEQNAENLIACLEPPRR